MRRVKTWEELESDGFISARGTAYGISKENYKEDIENIVFDPKNVKMFEGDYLLSPYEWAIPKWFTTNTPQEPKQS